MHFSLGYINVYLVTITQVKNHLILTQILNNTPYFSQGGKAISWFNLDSSYCQKAVL
jgi:hypothetical protein